MLKIKKLRNLVYEKINDTADSPDIDFSPKFYFSPVDEINKKQSDQIDFEKLRNLMKKISSLKPYKRTDFTIRTVSEYRKISDDINQLRISLLNEQMELEDDKKELERRIRTYQARSFEDQNK